MFESFPRMEAGECPRMGFPCLRRLSRTDRAHAQCAGACDLWRCRYDTLHPQPRICGELPEKGNQYHLEVFSEPSARRAAGFPETITTNFT